MGVATDVSEEHIASIFRAEEIISARTSETSVATQQTTRRHIPEDDTLQNVICFSSSPNSQNRGLFYWKTNLITHVHLLQSREVLSTNRRNAPKTATSAPDISQQKRPNPSARQRSTACRTINTAEVERIGPRNSASPAIFAGPLAHRLTLF
jgi:hypothetical protein